MTNTQKRLAAAIASAGLLLNSAFPVFATTIVISGNGAGSDNYTDVDQKEVTVVKQDNSAVVYNNVDSDSNSGHNEAEYNGGNVTIGTGEASSTANVVNTLNTNVAEVDCCETAGTDVQIKDNVAFSDNTVTLDQDNIVKLDQDNHAYVKNYVDADADSGHNDANLNNGEVAIVTGPAKTNVSVSTTANTNSARVGGTSGSASLPSASFIIANNGAGSDNWIDADLFKKVDLDQYNDAHVFNHVDADADSGHNDAKFNAGGEVLILTSHMGDTTADVSVDNAVNFNYADIDCGCTWDVLAKIEANGAEFTGYDHNWQDTDDNTILLDLDSLQFYGQDNAARLANDADADADSGKNDNSLNTGEYDGDPAIVTGPASSSTTVSNSGNSNVIGEGGPVVPWWPTEWSQVELSFNLNAFLAYFGLTL